MAIIFTQAECDEYLATITDLKIKHDFRSDVDKEYQGDIADLVDGVLVNIRPGGADEIFTGAGASEFYPQWRIDNPSVTAVSEDSNELAYDQWNKYTNDRSTWDAEVLALGEDIGAMEERHIEMLASVE